MEKKYKDKLNEMAQNVDHLTEHLGSILDLQVQLMGIVEFVNARVEKIEAMLKEETPVEAIDQTGALRPDQENPTIN